MMPDYLKVIINQLVLTVLLNYSLKATYCRIKVQNAVQAGFCTHNDNSTEIHKIPFSAVKDYSLRHRA